MGKECGGAACTIMDCIHLSAIENYLECSSQRLLKRLILFISFQALFRVR